MAPRRTRGGNATRSRPSRARSVAPKAGARGPSVAVPAAPAATARLPRVPKGRRAQFFGEPGVDQLFGIVAALTAELSVAFERIETLERVLERGGALVRDDIETHVPEADETAARAAAREALIERVFQVLEDYSESS